MSNSPLVNYTKISPCRTSPRNHKIDTITIHCVVGQCSVETLGDIFSKKSRNASSNYGIGPDGRIGMYVEEGDRSWCSSSSSNDNRAITIEVASDTTEPYAVKTKAYNALIELVADICKRNNIKELKWKGDKSLVGKVEQQNMTVHRWFANKSCPGTWLYERHGEIAKKVNAKLGVTTTDTKVYYRVRKTWSDSKSQVGAFVNLANAKKRADENPGYSVYDNEGKCLYTSDDGTFKEYKVRVSTDDLNIRRGPGTNYRKTGKFTGKGIFTIVEESDGRGSTTGWGKLKSGVGWISLDFTKKVKG